MKIDKLLDRYQKGEATQEEQRLVEQWLESPANEPSPWDEMQPELQDKWLQATHRRIEGTLDAKETKVLKLSSFRWWKLAMASAAVFIGFLVFFFWPTAENSLPTTSWTSINVPAGKKQYVVLNDGSSIWVNGGSEIKYTTAFGDQTREIYLSGEAYFDVKHDANKPFKVHTGKLTTTVLGTAFNITANKLSKEIKVAVTRGRVQVANESKVLGLLTPNEQLVYLDQSQSAIQSQVDAMATLKWLPDDLYFDNTTFDAAAIALEKRYNVQVKFDNEKLKNCRFTGTIKKDETLERALNVICEFNHATYKRKSNIVTVFGAGCEKTNQ